MKKLMLGNEAVARGLYEAGVKVVSSYPGTPSTEITEFAAKYNEIDAEWASNEKVATEVAVGACIAGARSFTAMKHVGLNVAADPLFTASYTGVNAGMVIAVADDPGMHSSQNEQDSRNYAKASKVPMLEPSDSQEAKDFTKLAFALSEQFDTPFLLRLSTRVSHSQSLVEICDRNELENKPYEKDVNKYVMMPGMAKKRHIVVEDRMASLAEYAETAKVNTVEYNDRKIGVITSGISYEYAKEALPDASFLKLGMIHPLPEKMIREFAENVETLYVIEELDDFIETFVKKIGILNVHGKDIFSLQGELNVAIIREKILGVTPKLKLLEETIPVRPPVLCPGCPHRGIFYTLNRLKLHVSGDIGCYTLGAMAPLSSIDICVCMGASVSGSHGIYKANKEMAKKTVAVIGDSTFIHSGITGLIDIAYNQGASTVIILDNSITGMTGHQQNPTTGYTLKGDPTVSVNLEKLVQAVGINRIRVVDPFDLEACEKAVKEETAVDEPSVIIARRPCALLKNVKYDQNVTVDQDKCTGCKMCMRLGCPAITMKGKKMEINKTLCNNCGLCANVCKFGAIKVEK
ncbi:indolepyruvate ferredoxin oxidoreductase subunit alpha [Acetivibrio sp. MSJd-27]|uniref:indolepyruvate ferredoxin oxidoreductase subunit alpha n=1 Tax=Acetivibrio sp. MSJd-27 TaxID=2841523 RepID=UPI001C0FBB79|nr:indolepyruvate ferredoxin oxidoreductase subunit alpha [Acetivibrio sp. MSJd-27]MBU5448990.1 indolepyruvate ferredoxin oxidoreductase subunit alpha [Acetivibrio sp. MSJd-27]